MHDTTVTVQADLVEGYMHTARAACGGWATLDCFRTQAEYADRDFLNGLRLLRLDASVTKIGIASPFRIDNGGLCPQARQDIHSDTLNYNVSATLRSPVLFGSELNPTVYAIYRAAIRIQRVCSFHADRRVALTHPAPELDAVVPRVSHRSRAHGSAQPALYCAVFNLCTLRTSSRCRICCHWRKAARWPCRTGATTGTIRTRGSLVSRRGARRLTLSALGLRDSNLTRRPSTLPDILKTSDDGVFAARIRLARSWRRDGEAAGFILPISPSTRSHGPTTVRGFQQNELGPVVYISRTSWTPFGGLTPCFAQTPAPGVQGQGIVPEGVQSGPWSATSNTGGGARSSATRSSVGFFV